MSLLRIGGRGGSVVKLRTPERELQGSNPTTAVKQKKTHFRNYNLFSKFAVGEVQEAT